MNRSRPLSRWTVSLLLLFAAPCRVSAQQDLRSQIKLYRELMRANREDPLPRMKLGEVYLAMGKPKRALKQYERVVAMDPGRADAWVEIGNCHLMRDDYALAIDAYERAIEIDAGLGPAYANLGLAHLKCGAPENAIAALKTSLEIFPDQHIAHYHLAESFLQVGEKEKAIEQFQACVERVPTLIQARMRLAEVLIDDGKYEDAAAVYESAQAKNPTDPEIYLALARLYELHVKNKAEALRNYKSYLRWAEGKTRPIERRVDALVEELYVAGLRAYSQGELEAAKTALRTVLEVRPAHKDAQKLMRRIRQRPEPSKNP